MLLRLATGTTGTARESEQFECEAEYYYVFDMPGNCF